MASRSTILSSAQRSFRIIRAFQQGFKPLHGRSTRTDCLTQSYRGFFSSGRRAFRSTRVTSLGPGMGTVLIGSSMAFMGFFKKDEKEKLSEHDQVRKVVSEGIVAKQTKDIKKASTRFHDALGLSTDFFHQNLITEKEHLNHRVFIYDQMANLSLDVGNFKQAEELFKETMKLALQLGMKQNDNAIVEMAMKMSIIHMYTGRQQLADKGFNFCISEQEKKLNSKEATENQPLILDPNQEKSINENTKVLLGQAYQHYAHVFMQKRDFKNAVTYSSKALDVALETLGDSDETVFVLINDLATCQIMLENYVEAEKVLKDGIKNSRRLNSVMESAMCSNLGALYIRTKRLDEAESTCKRGLSVAEKHYDSFMMGPCQMCLKKLAEVRGENVPEKEDPEKK